MERTVYIVPNIERIKLDNEISLALESDPAIGPGEEVYNKVPEFFNHNPFNSTTT
jgi:hypothetical protein